MMKDNVKDLTDLNDFMEGNHGLGFNFTCKKDSYEWIESVLGRFDYFNFGKRQKGVLKKYLIKMTGYTDRHIKRLIRQYGQFGSLPMKDVRVRHKFDTVYSNEDLDLLAKTDNLHNRLNGMAVKKIFETEYLYYHRQEYKRLSGISVSHIYNLRKTVVYQKKSLFFTKTKPRKVNIGERRAPVPDGKPGYIRVDTVHQGDTDKEKGVYYINAVDEVTQWEVVVSVEKISEAYLIPALTALLDQFPFVIIEFHSDNGGEYINQIVAALLNKLLIKLTKSRPRRSNDNALVECKNGAVIRKWMGYSYIHQKHADRINSFYKDHFNIYLNYYRPSIFPEIHISKKHKETKLYKYDNTMTPFVKFKSIPDHENYLKESFPIIDMEALVKHHSVNEFTERMVKAQNQLFDVISLK